MNPISDIRTESNRNEALSSNTLDTEYVIS